MKNAKIRYEAAAATDRGKVRSVNEDAYRLRMGKDGETGDFVLCDGMGGAAAGEVASRVAAAEMLRAMGSEAPSALLMQEAVSAANKEVYSQAQRDPALAGMGTTLVALAARRARAWVAHAGDSRCYRLRGSRLEALTRDHSLVEEQVRLGQLTPVEAAASPLRNIITRAVGSGPQVVADVAEHAVEDGDLYLLASDGLTREASGEQIAEILRVSAPLDRLCQELIDAANHAGGKDNITCMLVRAAVGFR